MVPESFIVKNMYVRNTSTNSWRKENQWALLFRKSKMMNKRYKVDSNHDRNVGGQSIQKIGSEAGTISQRSEARQRQRNSIHRWSRSRVSRIFDGVLDSRAASKADRPRPCEMFPCLVSCWSSSCSSCPSRLLATFESLDPQNRKPSQETKTRFQTRTFVHWCFEKGSKDRHKVRRKQVQNEFMGWELSNGMIYGIGYKYRGREYGDGLCRMKREGWFER